MCVGAAVLAIKVTSGAADGNDPRLLEPGEYKAMLFSTIFISILKFSEGFY